MENTNEMTAERSLEIIKKYMEQSRKNTTKNAGLPMIIWGGLCLVTALIVWHLWNTSGNAAWNNLWLVMALIGWGITVWMGHKEKIERQPQTFISKVMGHIWLSFGIFASVLPILMYVLMPLVGIPYFGVSYTPLIILLLGLCATATGLILHHGWIVAGGIIGGLLGAIFADWLHGPTESLVMAGVAVVTLIIPGILINWRKDYA